ARGEGERPRRVSPLVRRLAREHGVDVGAVTGTGSDGRVTRDDILRHVGAGAASAAPAGVEQEAGARVEPMSVLRRQIAAHMVRSRRTSAHVHTVFDVDLSEVARLRAEHREAWAAAGVRLTYLAFVARATAAALAEEPLVNAALSDDGERIVYRRDVNLGIAVALDDGLIVPVIRQADREGLAGLGRAIGDVAARARAGELAPDDVAGGTFTITNPGSFGSILGLPIINQPQVAILCVGAVERRPVVVDEAGTIEARTRCYLTLGFDHRLIDGAIADRFMARVKAGLESFDAALVTLA
ncbi:MAG: dihydrolipoamide acetyltransferase family protein, partial [Acidobacteria bacterium]|nr:dihydrolipoamide acetyltransferase family protein [Acidobacteriota bacterium]